MKKIVLLLPIFFAVLNNVYTTETSAPLALTKAEKAIRNFLEKKKIKADFIYDKRNSNILYVKYKTKTFKVRGLGKGGKEYGKYFKKEGPKANGFLWTVILENATAMHQRLMMQTSKHAYWKSFDFICRFNNEKQFYNVFAFGAKSPLMKEIIYVLGDLDKPQDNLRIYIGNVNYKKQDVDIKIKLDGKTLISQIFKPKEPFITDYFSYKISTGNHKLEISSSKIKTVTKEFKLDEKIVFFINCWNADRFHIQVTEYSLNNDIKVNSIDGFSIDFIKSEKGEPIKLVNGRYECKKLGNYNIVTLDSARRSVIYPSYIGAVSLTIAEALVILPFWFCSKMAKVSPINFLGIGYK